MNKNEALRYFKQWSDEDRAIMARIFETTGAVSFTPRQHGAMPSMDAFDKDGESVGLSFSIGTAWLWPKWEGRIAGLHWSSSQNPNLVVRLSRSPGETNRVGSGPVAAVVTCNNDKCINQWLTHPGDCEE